MKRFSILVFLMAFSSTSYASNPHTIAYSINPDTFSAYYNTTVTASVITIDTPTNPTIQ